MNREIESHRNGKEFLKEELRRNWEAVWEEVKV